MKQSKPKRAFRINAYQRPIILMAIIPLLIICILMTILFVAFFKDLGHMMIYGEAMAIPGFLEKWIVIIVGSLWAFFICNFLFAYNVSLNLCGGFKRVIRELDSILQGDHQRRIHCRKKDKLIRALADRINQLLVKLYGETKQEENKI